MRTTMLGERRIMLIRRFDRYWAQPGILPNKQSNLQDLGAGEGRIEQRLGFVSGLTMMACVETQSQTKSYAGLAAAIRRYCHPSVIRVNNEELFKRMIYNIFISNDDDHLRNHGFIWDPCLPGWRVVRQWRVCFEDYGVASTEQDKIASAFRHIDDISTPALRSLLP